MSYVKITNFAIKDTTNDIIRGTEHDDEYNAIASSFAGLPSSTETLTNKTVALGSNTVSGTTAQFNTALTDGDFATLAGSETLTNKALNGSLGATTPSTVVATTVTASGDSAFTSTGAITIPVGTTGQRPTATSGMLRLNTSTNAFEGYNSTTWGSIGSGATGAGSDQVFQENQLIVTTNYTLSTGKSAMSVGPITINSGVVVTIPSGYSWLVL